MIYVHSKGMMVDIISGSTSIDTEVATANYQPHYTWAHKLVRPLVK
jgi:phospholipase D1/2